MTNALTQANSSPHGRVSVGGDQVMRDLLLHDIRTPLAAIRGYAQLMRRRASTRVPRRDELFGTLESIEWAARRAERLLDELAQAREFNDNNELSPRREKVDLVALSLHIANELLAPGRQRITVLPSVPELVGCWHADQLAHVLTNVLGNALKYSRRDRDVLVTVRRRDDWAVLAVHDQGVGIPEAELSRVFEPGYRASNVIGLFSGTGIGLAGVRQIVAELGGTITLESRLGCGTRATVRLPISTERSVKQE